MTPGSRSDWEKLLPVIQAFVKGEPIQVLSYDNRWKDTDFLKSALHVKHRVRPEKVERGTWSISYEYTQGDVKGRGTFLWEGNSDETPVWPSGFPIKLIHETLYFEKSYK